MHPLAYQLNFTHLLLYFKYIGNIPSIIISSTWDTNNISDIRNYILNTSTVSILNINQVLNLSIDISIKLPKNGKYRK